LGSIVFACLAFQVSPILLTCIYVATAASDSLDGVLSRRLGATSYFGRVLDLISDKSLTTVSLLYAAARGVMLLPLAAVAARDVLVLGARLILVGGTPLLATSRTFGSFLALCVWGATLMLINVSEDSSTMRAVEAVYSLAGLAASANVVVRLYRARATIRSIVAGGQEVD